jgi:hypothetical protein
MMEKINPYMSVFIYGNILGIDVYARKALEK